MIPGGYQAVILGNGREFYVVSLSLCLIPGDQFDLLIVSPSACESVARIGSNIFF